MRIIRAITTAAVFAAIIPAAPAGWAAGSRGATVTAPAVDLASTIRPMPGLPQGYDRARFAVPSLTARDWRGCDALQRSLITAALTRPKVGSRCAMSGGTWRLTVDGSVVSGAENVAVVPVLTLDRAWAQGAFAWTPAERRSFAATFPTARSSTPSSRSAPATRNCAITRTGPATGDGCAYAVVPAGSLYGADSLLSLLSSVPDAVTCQLAATMVATLVAWDLSLGAADRAQLATRLTNCPESVTVVRARTPLDMAKIYQRNPYVPGSTMLASVEALATAPAGQVVTNDFFGIHVLPGSSQPLVPFGLLRTWDADVGWNRIEPKAGRYDWRRLDEMIANAKAQGRKVLYVLGPTPVWAASRTTDPPRRMSDLRRFVSSLAQRYGDDIYGYEMWNEANLRGYFTGTPAQMAVMTRTVKDTLTDEGVASLVVAASTTVRIMPTLYRFYPAYLAALKRVGWPIDVFALHTYPRPDGGPDEHTAGIVLVKSMLDAAHAPYLPIMDTELNYGLGGLDLPRRDIGPPLSGEYIAVTFLESVRLGLSSVAWYAWTSHPYVLLGLQLNPGTTQTNAFWTATHDLLVGAAFVGCVEQGPAIICGYDRDGTRFGVAYSPAGVSTTVTVPSTWRHQCTLVGVCRLVTGPVALEGMAPVVLRTAAAQ